MRDLKRYHLLPYVISTLFICSASVYAAERGYVDEQNWHGKDINTLIGLNDHYSFKSSATYQLSDGTIKHKLIQYYYDIPVYGFALAANEKAKNGEFFNVTGAYLKSVEPDLPSTRAKLSPKQALNIALKRIAVKHSTIENKRVEEFIFQDNVNTARLIYRISFVVEAPKVSRPYFFIDANTGEVIDQWNGLTTRDATGPGGNEKTGKYQYGKDFGPLDVTNDCLMDSTNVSTINMNNQTQGGSIFKFTCPENTYKFTNGAYSPLNDAHFFGHVIFDMYKQWFNTAPINVKLKLRVHYGQNYENAFWDGQQMTFGDGASTFYPLVSLDVVAHEVSHGYTEQNSNLDYSKQPGGINEAFSDEAGEAAEYFMNSSKPTDQRNDWLVGAQIFKGSGALRYFADPTKDGMSIDNASKYNDKLDVHYTSGVFNKAFYTLATKANWNTEIAFRAFALANKVYWTQTTSFNQGGCGVMRAAKDLNLNTQDVIDAFKVVGVDATCSNPDPDPTPDATELKNGTTIRNISGTRGAELNYFANIAAATKSLKVTETDGFGGVDLYVRFGAKPTTTTYDCKAPQSSSKSCTINSPKTGKYYVMLKGRSFFLGASLVANFTQ